MKKTERNNCIHCLIIVLAWIAVGVVAYFTIGRQMIAQ